MCLPSVLCIRSANTVGSTYFVLGILDRRRGKPEAAEASFMEAQNMWFKGDQTRLHPFNAGCIYQTGVVCLDQGKLEAAMYVRFFFIFSSPPHPSGPQEVGSSIGFSTDTFFLTIMSHHR
jgi:hypothetical protein